MTWLINLVEKLFAFVPRLLIVEPDEAGIRVTMGTRVKRLSPGWFIYWPLIQAVTVVIVTVQIKDIREQSLVTRDGKNIIIGGAVQYKITDAEKALLRVLDYDSVLQILVIGTISDYISSRDYEACKDLDELEQALLKKTREVASGFGLKVIRVFITDFCQARTYRIVGMLPGYLKRK